jgi:CHAT domain-containing protein
LLAGKDKVNSLRNAQLELEKKYPSPYYWGSFVLIIKP